MFEACLLLAALLCALVAGFLFAFAVVAMPGLGRLDDGPFLAAFQAMDRVIQRNAPLFLVVWVGSVAALVASAVLGVGRLGAPDLTLLLGATAAYLAGVQLPTALVNVPLNNRLQKLDVAALDPEALRQARAAFEPRWNRWNRARTGLALGVAAALLVLVYRL